MTSREKRAAGAAGLALVPTKPKAKPPQVQTVIQVALLSSAQVQVVGPLETHPELCREMLREAIRVVDAAEAEKRSKIVTPAAPAILGPDGQPAGRAL